MFKDKVYTLLFLFLGVGFILVGYLLSNSTVKKRSESILPVAQLEKLSGTVNLQRKDRLKPDITNDNESLSNLDMIETLANSQAEIIFPDGTSIRIDPESKIVLDRENNHPLIVLQKGKINLERYGNESKVTISYNGFRVSVKEWDTWFDEQINSKRSGNRPIEAFPSSKDLSEKFVAETIQNHKSKFLQCYHKLLQRTPGQTGSVTLAFTIEKNGRISNPHIASAALPDPIFRSCLIEALNRIEFKAFEGEPVSTVIPINFE